MTDLSTIGNLTGSSNAITRWATFGPYYAMFPIEFAFQVVNDYSNPGDYIIDPFAGRFSTVYAGAVLGRHAVGLEINPVGWMYGKVKLNPAPKAAVLTRLKEIGDLAATAKPELEQLREFFQMCFSANVLKFLWAAREHLDWRSSKIDRTLMAIILVNLHGKLGEGLSNQMRQTKAMSPSYSVAWWKRQGMAQPPVYDPVGFLTEKVEWRYRKGVPQMSGTSTVVLGEATQKLPYIQRTARDREIRYSLLLTSPPYHSVVNYHDDQWLRLWLMNHAVTRDRFARRFDSKSDYIWLLDRVFGQCAKLMANRSTVVVRTDVREFTLDTTIGSLKKHFPSHALTRQESKVRGISQTALFNNTSKLKEIDIILTK